MDSGLSASDVLALTKDQDGMFGGNGAWIIIILLFLIGGGGFWSGNQASRTATVEDLNNSANFTRLENQVANNGDLIERKLDGVNNGLCTLGYQTAEKFGNLNTQISQCCCDIKTAIHAEGETTRALIQQNKIEALQQRINSLEMNAAVAGVVRYPTTTSYCSGANPFATNCTSNI